jgi:hypothetical protein
MNFNALQFKRISTPSSTTEIASNDQVEKISARSKGESVKSTITLTANYENVEKLLLEEQLSLVSLIKQKFCSIKDAVEETECQILNEINFFFKFEGRKLNRTFKNSSNYGMLLDTKSHDLKKQSKEAYMDDYERSLNGILEEYQINFQKILVAENAEFEKKRDSIIESIQTFKYPMKNLTIESSLKWEEANTLLNKTAERDSELLSPKPITDTEETGSETSTEEALQIEN